ncbi:hypothetical protein PG997_004735 [Apiospora hydei]|uniref:FAD-binding domain-containing protein n=1 Tax=Apiospora hydei TaxID=1337664 RepID=A0ABR1X312_9PEZI
MTPTPSSPHVLIEGSPLARSCGSTGVSFEIFERSESRYARPEGWAVALHAILPEFFAAMPDDMPPHNELTHLHPLKLGFEFAFYDPEVSMTKMGYRDDYRDDGEVEVIRANRHRLRDWLLTNLPVQNGKQAVQVEENEDKVTVHFRDGTSATGDILVGADGVKSVVRKHLLKGVDQFEYDKISILTSSLRLEGEDLAEQLALGHSAYMVVLQGPDGVYYRYFVGLDKVAPDGKSADYYFHLAWHDEDAPRDDHWTHSLSAEEIRDFALRAMQNLPRQFRCMVERAKLEDIKVPPLRLVTILLDSLPAGRVTILGDAAHAMTPFLAQGAVHAIKDALSLGKALTTLPDSSRSTIATSLGSYQEVMLARGRQAAMESRMAFADPSLPKTMFARQVVSLPEDRITL